MGTIRIRMMLPVLAAALAAAPALRAEGDAGVEALPLSMTTQVDAGQVVKGHFNDLKVEDEFLQRTSVWLTQEVLIEKRLRVKAGVGGVFWYALPGGEIGGDAAHKNLTRFGPGISQVQ